jgi:hypothetical protein
MPLGSLFVEMRWRSYSVCRAREMCVTLWRAPSKRAVAPCVPSSADGDQRVLIVSLATAVEMEHAKAGFPVGPAGADSSPRD